MFDPADQGTSFRSANRLADKFVVLYAGAHGMSNDLGVALEAAKILQDAPEHFRSDDRVPRRWQGKTCFAETGC